MSGAIEDFKKWIEEEQKRTAEKLQELKEESKSEFLNQDSEEIQESAENINNEPVRCPKCGSAQITAQRKGFSLGKAAVGGILLGPYGLLGGVVGSRKIEVICLSCGNKWVPGK